MLGWIKRRYSDLATQQRDIDALYQVLYDRVHDLDQAAEITDGDTVRAFGRQWSEHAEGEYLLSDPWFKSNVGRILCEQELLLRPDWFASKRVLDAGCGNGRWTYGLSTLGTDLTSVDANDSALVAAREATEGLTNTRRFVRTSLEDLGSALAGEQFDLVFCWGVAHHCVRFNTVLDNLAAAVAPGGMLYLYLYGRDTISAEDELRTFRHRVAYNVLMDDDERRRFLLRKAHGNRDLVHSMHDIFAPLVNRRFTFAQTAAMLAARGFTDAVQTIDHTEVFVRATRGDIDLTQWTLAPKRPPYWFEGKYL